MPFILTQLFTICFTVYAYNFSLQKSDLQLGVSISIMVSEAQNNVRSSCSSCVIFFIHLAVTETNASVILTDHI